MTILKNDTASANGTAVRQVFAEVFKLDPGEVNEAMSPENIDAWDSFGHMQLITALEQRIGVRLRMDQILAIDCYAALCRVLGAASCAK